MLEDATDMDADAALDSEPSTCCDSEFETNRSIDIVNDDDDTSHICSGVSRTITTFQQTPAKSKKFSIDNILGIEPRQRDDSECGLDKCDVNFDSDDRDKDESNDNIVSSGKHNIYIFIPKQTLGKF